jgi:hypothetical protein
MGLVGDARTGAEQSEQDDVASNYFRLGQHRSATLLADPSIELRHDVTARSLAVYQPAAAVRSQYYTLK